MGVVGLGVGNFVSIEFWTDDLVARARFYLDGRLESNLSDLHAIGMAGTAVAGF